MIADASKVTLYSGPVEATALGNLLTQFMALEKIESVSEARRLVTKTQEIEKYYPDLIETDEWENNFWKYAEILNQEIKI
jgi:rhamnulokinase